MIMSSTSSDYQIQKACLSPGQAIPRILVSNGVATVGSQWAETSATMPGGGCWAPTCSGSYAETAATWNLNLAFSVTEIDFSIDC
jgi:hypothetical protein